jgi:hypothetical protein
MAADKELNAMTAIAQALDSFDESESETVSRILHWALSRYKISAPSAKNSSKNSAPTYALAPDGAQQQFSDIAELFSIAAAKTDVERALLAGYWLMTGENKADFTGQEANDHLKNLGHPVGNITDAFTSLITRRPALVMQVAKSGPSKQARKRYKLTRAGIEHVAKLVTGTETTDE